MLLYQYCGFAARGDSTADCWNIALSKDVVRKHIQSYCKLAIVARVLPSTSVENERHFSLMALLKDARRNRMGPEMLNGLCIVQRSEHTLGNFPYKQALQIWNEKDRRMSSR